MKGYYFKVIDLYTLKTEAEFYSKTIKAGYKYLNIKPLEYIRPLKYYRGYTDDGTAEITIIKKEIPVKSYLI